MGVSNYTPTGISHATSVDFSKRSVNQPVHIVQYDRTLPILAVSLYNNGQLYRLSETMEVSIRLGKPDRTFVYNKALGCDSTRTIVYFEITQQMSLFDGEFYPVIEIVDGDKIANSSTIYLVVDRNPVQHDYIESTVEYKELINYRDEAIKAGNEAKEAAKVAKESAQTVVDKTKEAVEASETAVNAANSASASAESILGVEENVTRIGNMVSEKEPIITEAAEVASTSATNAKSSEDKAKKSEEAAKLSETNATLSETNAKASEEASKLSETNAKASEEASKLSETNAKESETNAKAYVDSIEEIAKASESYAHGGTGTREGEDTDNARYYMEQAKAVSAVDVATADKAGIVKPDGTTITVDEDGTLHGQSKVDEMTGATADKDGTSGTVPAPTAGQEAHILNGDGTWTSPLDNELIASKFKELDENKSDAVFDKSTGKKVVFTIENGIICAREA